MQIYLERKLKELNFVNITPIQKKVFTSFEQPLHLVGISPTGTGKTHAYLLPILSKIAWQRNIIQAVIIAPTNELVFQIFQMLKGIEKQNSKVKIFYGGMDQKKITSHLKTKQPPVVIATLNQLVKYTITNKQLNIYKASFLVLDEADMLFDSKSLSLINLLLIRWHPKILLFSASITTHMKPFVDKYFGKSLFLNTNKEQRLKIKYYALHSFCYKRLNDLVHLAKKLNPYAALIFVSNKKNQFHVYETLKKENLNVLNFSSDLLVKQRKRYISEIHKNKYQYIVSSDLTARGLDLDISWVIHYDLPIKNLEFFQHRSGRTGRLGKEGNVLVLYDEKEKTYLEKIKKLYQITFQNIELTPNGYKTKISKSNIFFKKNVHNYKLQNCLPNKKKLFKRRVKK
ncbi:MAG: DEAD/DEAH box helicase [Weeping tea tree witches'-broom phytoplasma]|uniref:DEAD/DEAH box helicase n=1 Tax=Candidatus Phytoplasma melaleucae TaxID=2982630 RepID=UPI00293A545D|nr:DEAD/DEAH box helicase [Weeping tea tree witches'-broom phytoplasma]